MEGYVYVLSNECMPGIYKIGCTTKTARERAEELSKTTSIPTSFKVELSFFVYNTIEAEKLMHEELKAYRVNPNKEFFKADLNLIEQASSCLYNNYLKVTERISEDINFTGENYYRDNYLKMLETNSKVLKEKSYKFDWFRDIFKKDGSYYIAQCCSKVCSVKQYNNWVNEKICQEHKEVNDDKGHDT
jgi:hypothetical protein